MTRAMDRRGAASQFGSPTPAPSTGVTGVLRCLHPDEITRRRQFRSRRAQFLGSIRRCRLTPVRLERGGHERADHRVSAGRRRQRWPVADRRGVLGLLASSLAGIGLGRLAWVDAARRLARAWPGRAGGRPVLGLIVGAALAAAAGTRRLGGRRDLSLKDRSATALEFLDRPQTTPLHELQIERRRGAPATAQGARGRPVPPAAPCRTPCAALVVAAVPARLAARHASRPPPGPLAPSRRSSPRPSRSPRTSRSSTNWPSRSNDKELEKLVKELQEKVEELKQPGVDDRGGDGQDLRDAGRDRRAAGPVQRRPGRCPASVAGRRHEARRGDRSRRQGPPGEQVRQGRQEAREAREPAARHARRPRPLEEKIKQVAKEMGDVGLGQMGGAATEMAEGLKGGQQGEVQEGRQDPRRASPRATPAARSRRSSTSSSRT